VYNRNDILKAELPTKKELLRLFNRNEKLTIFDIGGCEGEDSLLYAKLFKNSSVYVFEPLPENQKLILNNLERYNAASVQLVPVALSDENGFSDFYVSSGQPAVRSDYPDWDFGNKSSSLLPPEEVLQQVDWLKFDAVIKVRTRTLLQIALEYNIETIDFIHMDVQGAELKVLQGAGDFLHRIKAVWLEIAETRLYKNQPLRSEVETSMQEKGFQLIKTELEGKTGNQLYINNNFFKLKNFWGLRRYVRL